MSELDFTDVSQSQDDVAFAWSIIQAGTHKASLDGGWWADARLYDAKLMGWLYATKIALIHSEVSEALEGLRKGTMDQHLPHRLSVEVELADAIIRIGDLAGHMGLDVGGAIVEKMAYNAKRADHKAEHRAGVGGKKF